MINRMILRSTEIRRIDETRLDYIITSDARSFTLRMEKKTDIRIKFQF